MANKASFTADFLRQVLNYGPETGVFTWINRPNNSIKAGSVAGCPNEEGYIKIKINNVLHSAHRLAWLYMTGKFPSAHIDHINGNTSDNRFCNLREATRSQNLQNCKLYKTSSTGYTGVTLDQRSNKYQAHIQANKKRYWLGMYDTAEEAHDAYLKAKSELHFQKVPRYL